MKLRTALIGLVAITTFWGIGLIMMGGYSLLKDYPLQWRGFNVEYDRISGDPDYKWIYKPKRDIQWWPLEISESKKKRPQFRWP